MPVTAVELATQPECGSHNTRSETFDFCCGVTNHPVVAENYPSRRGPKTTALRTKPTLDFRAVLTQHPLAPTAHLLLRRGACLQSGRSRGSILPKLTLHFRCCLIRQERCGTLLPFVVPAAMSVVLVCRLIPDRPFSRYHATKPHVMSVIDC